MITKTTPTPSCVVKRYGVNNQISKTLSEKVHTSTLISNNHFNNFVNGVIVLLYGVLSPLSEWHVYAVPSQSNQPIQGGPP